MADVGDTELLDYEEEDQAAGDATTAANGAAAATGAAAGKKDVVKGTYVSIHSSGFRDFLLKPEILRAIVDCGFEHPSEGERIKNTVYWKSRVRNGERLNGLIIWGQF